jgi:SAM-dependent methyltransferase
LERIVRRFDARKAGEAGTMLRAVARRLVRRTPGYDDPARYWDARARDLRRTYDRPETWVRRGWMRAGVEEAIVPDLLRRAGVNSVLVIGVGSGRQYAYLDGFELSGIDISPKLVRVCRRRYPEVDTLVGDVTELEHPPVDAVLSGAVLQHVRPAEIERTVERICATASKLIVLRECTWLAAPRAYQFVHDYRTLFAACTLVHAEVTDEFADVVVELLAFRRE